MAKKRKYHKDPQIWCIINRWMPARNWHEDDRRLIATAITRLINKRTRATYLSALSRD